MAICIILVLRNEIIDKISEHNLNIILRCWYVTGLWSQ